MAYKEALGERLLAAYALGSLAHGGFSPLVSDIDLGLVVDDPVEPQDMETIQSIAQSQKASGLRLAERLSVFWGTPSTLSSHSPGGRFPALDRLDLLENGRLLIGVEARRNLQRPTEFELLTAGAEFALEFLAGTRSSGSRSRSGLGSMRMAGSDAIEELRHPEVLVAAGVRRLTKLVLFPVRFMFTAATGRVGTNDDAGAWYLETLDVPSKPLVGAALAWRSGQPIDEAIAVDLLGREMVPLYLYYIDDHVRRLNSQGAVELANAFREWRAHLRPESDKG